MLAAMVVFCVVLTSSGLSSGWSCDCQSGLVGCNVYGLSQEVMDSLGRSALTGNLLVSPYGLWMVLLYAYKAAQGDTERRLSQILFSNSGGQVCDYKSAANRYFTEYRPIDHAASHSFWFRASIIHSRRIRRSYLPHIRNQAWHWRINYAEEEGTLKMIRDYHAGTYTNKGNFLQSGDITKKTEFVIQTLLRFESEWKVPFAEISTVRYKDNRYFTMMKTSGDFFQAHDTGRKTSYIYLEFKNKDLLMVIAKPDTSKGKAETSWDMLDPGDKQIRNFNLSLPSFSLEAEYSLYQVMRDLNNELLFRDNCDLSGMTGFDGPASQLVQRTVVKVDQDGVKLQAYTALVVDPYGTARRQKYDSNEQIPAFTFYLFVKDTVVAQGRIMDPTYLK